MDELLSTKPYLLRAIHEWCTDCGLTPYIAVAVDARTRVPTEFVRAGEIVLNISVTATNRLVIGADWIEFQARFGGRVQELLIPVDNVSAIYARENGHGMAFEVTKPAAEPAEQDAPVTAAQPSLRAVPTDDVADSKDLDDSSSGADGSEAVRETSERTAPSRGARPRRTGAKLRAVTGGGGTAASALEDPPTRTDGSEPDGAAKDTAESRASEEVAKDSSAPDTAATDTAATNRALTEAAGADQPALDMSPSSPDGASGEHAPTEPAPEESARRPASSPDVSEAETSEDAAASEPAGDADSQESSPAPTRRRRAPRQRASKVARDSSESSSQDDSVPADEPVARGGSDAVSSEDDSDGEPPSKTPRPKGRPTLTRVK